jgi:multiple sugar transport system permease protein
MNGGEFMSADGKTCTLNDPKIVGALDWMTRVYDKLGGAKSVYAFQSTFQSGDLDPFILGKIGIKIDGVWVLDSMAQFATHLNWGAAPPPMPEAEVAKGRKTLSWVGGWAYSIPSTAKHKDAAWALIRFMSTQRANQIMSESARLTARSQGRTYVPVQHPNIKINEWLAKTYVYDDPATDPKISHALHVFNDLLSVSRYRPVTMVGQLLWVEHINAMENAIFHKMSPQEALDHGTAIVQRELDDALQPAQGWVPDWSIMIGVYVACVVLLAIFIYLWDTRYGLRSTVATLLAPLGGKRLLATGSDLGGTNSKFFRSQWKDGWALASPWIIGFIFLTGGPLAFSILISFCRYDILNPAHFVGLDNYTWMANEPMVWKALWNTTFMMIGIPLGMALSLGIALLLNLKIKGIAVWRTFFFVPSIIPVVASSILWLWIFNPSSGLFNSALASLGIDGPNWLQDEHTSKISLIIMGLWGAGGGMIVWLAGLKGISESYYEAASLDGADRWQKFTYVTIPMLSPYIFFNTVMGIIGTLKIFDQAFIMTSGGPVNSTMFFVYELFRRAFRFLQMGRASAEAWVLFILIFILTMVQLSLSKRWVHYEGD